MDNQDYLEHNIDRLLNSTEPRVKMPDTKKQQILSELIGNAPAETNPVKVLIAANWGKIVSSAAAVIVAALSLTIFNTSITPAYALEQTIEANHNIRFLHMKAFRSGYEVPKEYWLQCDEFGEIINSRWYMPEWDAPEDGAKAVVWKEGKIYIWFKGTERRKSCLTFYE